jgi:hypothetical protein
MSLTITTLDARDGSDNTYALIGADSVTSKRIDTASTLAEPKLLVVKHSVSGAGAAAIDRHLVQCSVTKLNSAGVPRTGTVNLTVAMPRDTIITTAEIEDCIANIVSLLCNHAFSATTGFTNDTVIVQLLRGEN